MNTPDQSAQINLSDELDMLVILLDVNPYTWGKRQLDMNSAGSSKLISFSQFVHQLLVFINTYLTTQRNKKIAVIASSENNKSQFLYPRRSKSRKDKHSNQVQIHTKSTDSASMLNMMGFSSGDDVEDFFLHDISFENVEKAVLSGLIQLTEDHNEALDQMVDEDGNETVNHAISNAQGFSLCGALSMALCFINRLEKEKPVGMTLNSRILTFQVSPDISSQYISVMNAIFSAEKMVSMVIMVCVTCVIEYHARRLCTFASRFHIFTTSLLFDRWQLLEATTPRRLASISIDYFHVGKESSFLHSITCTKHCRF